MVFRRTREVCLSLDRVIPAREKYRVCFRLRGTVNDNLIDEDIYLRRPLHVDYHKRAAGRRVYLPKRAAQLRNEGEMKFSNTYWSECTYITGRKNEFSERKKLAPIFAYLRVQIKFVLVPASRTIDLRCFEKS